MKNDTHEPITYARFNNLIEELSVLEDLLRCFENEETMHIEKNIDTLEPIIAELLQYSVMYQRAISAHLEECREWDAFPEEFWTANNKQQTISSYTERYPWDGDLFSKVEFVIEAVKRTTKLVDNCLQDYQHSGYISHQPVAIDLLDTLIEINSDFTYLNDSLLDLSLQNEDDRFPPDPVDMDGFMPDSQERELNEMEQQEIERLRLQMEQQEQQRRYMQRRNIHRR